MATADGTVITSVEELKQYIGQETRVGDWHLVTQEEINQFADATGDHQWIHVDPERAKAGPFKGTIAHGYWTLSAAPFTLRGGQGIQVRLPSRMGINYGLNRVRFINPVPVGKRIRGHSKLVSVEEVQPGIIQQVNEITVEIEGEQKPAMVAESITRTYLETQA
ncbi:MAG: MaoC family dehydratase [Chloroflexi bacterium]|nr:MaoC family dehydratase [Chloroflexota bacterium]MBV9898227.1 MaoC family dehydratase [Chloroflexota bacterium]